MEYASTNLKETGETVGSGRSYQIVFWLKPEGSRGDFPQETYDKILRAITVSGGALVSEVKPSKKQLAYPIRHLRQAFFGEILADLPPAAPASIVETLRHEDSILRLNIFKFEEKIAPAPRLRRRFQKISLGPKVAAAERRSEAPAKVDLEALDKKLEEILKT